MNLSTVRASVTDPVLACLAVLASSCITPPSAANPASTGGAPGAAPSALIGKPREFKHTAAEIMASAGIGWNVGNSLDVPDGETAWGNPKVSEQLINAVAHAGFGLVRIPVTWTKHMGPAPDYTIEPSWFERVDEVVGYARSAGLYAVVNVHHDGADGFKGAQWLTLKDADGKTTEANNAAVRARFVKVWTQIAKHFSNAGEELLFESMNEVHDGYGKPNPLHYEFINELNQEFVNTVRASGGNNDKRSLIVPGYNTNIDQTLEGFTLPRDSAENRLILSVHYYDPYQFALAAQTHTWGKASPGHDDFGQEDDVVKQFDKLKTNFIDRGVPVLMGEYGATNQDGYEDYRRYYMEYVTKAAIMRGIVPVYWDNGGTGSGGEKSGLFDRSSGEVRYPEILAAMMRAKSSGTTLAGIALPKGK